MEKGILFSKTSPGKQPLRLREKASPHVNNGEFLPKGGRVSKEEARQLDAVVEHLILPNFF
ncbi:MAG: hypothetical protein HFJ36_04120 [Clostridia bacterium]|nr:hypothetical protein [Clostridia bacterium]